MIYSGFRGRRWSASSRSSRFPTVFPGSMIAGSCQGSSSSSEAICRVRSGRTTDHPPAYGGLSQRLQGRGHRAAGEPGVLPHLDRQQALPGRQLRSKCREGGYDGDALRAAIKARGITPCIPPRKGRKNPAAYCKATCRRRNLVERMFGRLKDWRRIATRYDRCAHTFSAICIAATVVC